MTPQHEAAHPTSREQRASRIREATCISASLMVWAPKPERYTQFPYLIVQRGEEATAPAGIEPLAHTVFRSAIHVQ
jgi:hypothetical protein